MSAPVDFFPIDGNVQGYAPGPDYTWHGIQRACCLCKRNKVRCEGGRPCTACIKKGMSPESCIDGCIGCRHNRLLCNGGTPCTNCQSSARECVYHGTNAPKSSEASLPLQTVSEDIPPQHQQSQGSRTKIACLACRRDNKKCEDTRPCGRCQLKQKECISLERTQTIVKKRCLPCRMHNRKCEDQRPCARCVEEGETCLDVDRKGTGPGSRVKKACTNCKRLKVQCGDGWPCKSCVRRKLECDAQDNPDSIVSTPDTDDVYQPDRPDRNADYHGVYEQSSIAGPSSLTLDSGEVLNTRRILNYNSDIDMFHHGAPATTFPSVPVPLGAEGLSGVAPALAPSVVGVRPNYTTPAIHQWFDGTGYATTPQTSTAVFVPMTGAYIQFFDADAGDTHEAGSSMNPSFTSKTSEP